MNIEISFIFTHQLFRPHSCLKKSNKVVLLEDHLHFTQSPLHKQKLLLHRASMLRFILPSDYKLNDLPSPNNGKVQMNEDP